MDLIILIIIISVIISRKKKMDAMRDSEPANRQKSSAKPNKPRRKGLFGRGQNEEKASDSEWYLRSRKAKEKTQDILKKANEHIYGTDADQADLLLYKNYIEVQRETEIRKIAKKMNCTMYQVVSELKQLQGLGYFPNILVDDKNYRIHYKDHGDGGSMGADSLRAEDMQDFYDNRQERYEAMFGEKKSGNGDADRYKTGPKKTASKKPAAGKTQNAVCEVCEHDEQVKKEASFKPWEVGYMTMPEGAPSAGYMTGDPNARISYMTMPEGGSEIRYNTMP